MIKLCEKQRKNFPWEILTPKHERWDEFAIKMMSSKNSCDNTLRRTAAILWEMKGIDVQGTLEYLESNGSYCDCEVFLNVISPYPDKAYRNLSNTLTMSDTMINLYCVTKL